MGDDISMMPEEEDFTFENFAKKPVQTETELKQKSEQTEIPKEQVENTAKIRTENAFNPFADLHERMENLEEKTVAVAKKLEPPVIDLREIENEDQESSEASKEEESSAANEEEETIEANEEEATTEAEEESSEEESSDDSEESSEEETDSSSDEDEDISDFDFEEFRARLTKMMAADEADQKKAQQQQHVFKQRLVPTVIEEDLFGREIKLAGVVQSVVENVVSFGPEDCIKPTQILNFGAALCLEDRTKLGVIRELIGLVEQPLYTVVVDMEKVEIKKGTRIFWVPSLSEKLLSLKKDIDQSKPSDLSPEDATEFYSDDEQEQKALEEKKKKQQSSAGEKPKSQKKRQRERRRSRPARPVKRQKPNPGRPFATPGRKYVHPNRPFAMFSSMPHSENFKRARVAHKNMKRPPMPNLLTNPCRINQQAPNAPVGMLNGPKPPVGMRNGPKPPVGMRNGPMPPVGMRNGPKPPGGMLNGPKSPGGMLNGPKPPGGMLNGPKPPVGMMNGPKPPARSIFSAPMQVLGPSTSVKKEATSKRTNSEFYQAMPEVPKLRQMQPTKPPSVTLNGCLPPVGMHMQRQMVPNPIFPSQQFGSPALPYGFQGQHMQPLYSVQTQQQQMQRQQPTLAATPAPLFSKPAEPHWNR